MVSKKGSRTIKLPEEVDLQLRLIAAEERIPVVRLIESAVKQWLKDRSDKKA